jgi:predicted dehydrogenase
MRAPVNVAVVAPGDDWAEELARRLHDHPQAELSWLCGLDPRQRLQASAVYPRTKTTADPQELFDDETVDAVVLSAPLDDRAALARRALDAGKHVLLEEPIALGASAAAELVSLAARHGRRLTPTHSLAFHPAVRKLKELIGLGWLGELYYAVGNLEHLDPHPGQSVLWSLGAPEISLLLHLVGDEPVEAAAWADAYRQPGAPDVASCRLGFATGVSVHIHLGWLCPQPRHRITFVGSQRTAIFDEHDRERPLTVYEQGAHLLRGDRWLDAPPRVGRIVSPRVGPHDPVGATCDYFLEAVRSGADDGADGRRGVAVVSALEAIQVSLERGRAPTAVAVGGSASSPPGLAPRARLKSV